MALPDGRDDCTEARNGAASKKRHCLFDWPECGVSVSSTAGSLLGQFNKFGLASCTARETDVHNSVRVFNGIRYPIAPRLTGERIGVERLRDGEVEEPVQMRKWRFDRDPCDVGHYSTAACKAGKTQAAKCFAMSTCPANRLVSWSNPNATHPRCQPKKSKRSLIQKPMWW
mgnify:CR=1 FL=1